MGVRKRKPKYGYVPWVYLRDTPSGRLTIVRRTPVHKLSKVCGKQRKAEVAGDGAEDGDGAAGTADTSLADAREQEEFLRNGLAELRASGDATAEELQEVEAALAELEAKRKLAEEE